MENEYSSSAMGISHSSGQASAKQQMRRGSVKERENEHFVAKKQLKLREKSKKGFQRDLENIMANALDENLARESKKVRFTEEEDEEIIRLIKIHGKKWRLISELMNGKNQTRIRNRYYSRLREVLGETGVNGSEENEGEDDERSSDVREEIQIKQEDLKNDDENCHINESGHFRNFKSMNQLQLQDSDMKIHQQFEAVSPLAKHKSPERYHIGSFNHFPFESSPIHYQQDLLFQTHANQENSKLKYQLHSLPCLNKHISFSELQDSLIEEPPLGDYVTKRRNHNFQEPNNISITLQPDDSINNQAISKRRELDIPALFRPNAFLLHSSDGFLDEPSPLIFQKKQLLAGSKGNNFDHLQEDRQFSSFNGEEEDKIGFRDMQQGEEENDAKYQYYQEEDQLQASLSNQEKLQKIQFLNKQILYISQMLEQCRQQIAKELMIKSLSNQA